MLAGTGINGLEQRAAGDGLEPGMRLEEIPRLRAVLVVEDGAGDVDQRAPRLHVARAVLEDRLLLGDAQRHLLGGELPFGVGAAAPGARPGTRRIDHDAIHFAKEIVEGPLARRPHLHVARAVALQPVVNRREAMAVAVVGEDLALVAHRRGHGERFAAAAGAEVEHLLAGPGADQHRDDLAALVLHFEPALEVALLDLDVGGAAVAGPGRDADAVGGDGGRFSAEAREALEHPGPVGLQRVDAQIERRAAGHRVALADPERAEALLEGRHRPFGNIGADMLGRAGQRIGGTQPMHLVDAEDFGRVGIGREQIVELFGGFAPVANVDAQHQRTGRIAAHAVGVAGALAQRVVDQIADGGAIAGAGEAVVETPGLQGLGHRAMTLVDVVDDLDGGRQPAGQPHQLPPR